jgi:hypothetical protein
MNDTETIEIAELVQRVQSWPAPMRIALARQILEHWKVRQQARKNCRADPWQQK